MTAGKSAVMTRIETLKKIQRLFSAYLADYQAIRSHTKGRPDQLSDPDLPGSLCIGIPGLQTYQIFDVV